MKLNVQSKEMISQYHSIINLRVGTNLKCVLNEKIISTTYLGEPLVEEAGAVSLQLPYLTLQSLRLTGQVLLPSLQTHSTGR